MCAQHDNERSSLWQDFIAPEFPGTPNPIRRVGIVQVLSTNRTQKKSARSRQPFLIPLRPLIMHRQMAHLNRLTLAILLLTSASAQSTSIDTKLAAQYFQQLKQTSDLEGGKTWGMALYGPIMFVDPRSGNVVANQADLEHKLEARDGAFVGTLPKE